MPKRTKIIATVGPATESVEMLTSLYQHGVNIIRFNFSHADHMTAGAISERIQTLNASGKTSLSLLLDTKGPELRIRDMREPLHFVSGEEFFMASDESIVTHEKIIFCDYPFLIEDVSLGQCIEIDSGLFHVEVVEKYPDRLKVVARNDATVTSRRHVNLPGVKIRLPGITEKDKEDILFGIENGFHFIAASFIRTADNVREIRAFLDEHGGQSIKIISKIENEEGIENLESIIKISDGVMVARGDLGIEVPIEKVPKYQKRIIDLCRQYGKFVIVATHMLESMIEHPFPTRAEVSDIFRAVLQGVDATMLSGETTTGKYPIDAVDMMRSVINEAEEDLDRNHYDFIDTSLTERDIEKKSLIHSALTISENLQIPTVVLFTKSGRLARLAASYRPNHVIHAFSPSSDAVGFMRLLYAVEPHLLLDWGDHRTNLQNALQHLLQEKSISNEDRVIAVTDVMHNDREIPVLEIITIADIFS